VASLLALLALVTLGLKLLAERHMSAELSAARDVPAYAGPATLPSSSSSPQSVNAPRAAHSHPVKQGEL
jgi:sulfate/thiosulfate transport system permease protein